MRLDCNRLLTRPLTLWLVFGRCQPPATGVEYHSFRPFSIRVDPDVDPLVQREGRERAIGTEEHQLAANSAATGKFPTHPKYFNNGMVTVSAPICRLQFAAAGLAEIPQRVHLVDQVR